MYVHIYICIHMNIYVYIWICLYCVLAWITKRVRQWIRACCSCRVAFFLYFFLFSSFFSFFSCRSSRACVVCLEDETQHTSRRACVARAACVLQFVAVCGCIESRSLD